MNRVETIGFCSGQRKGRGETLPVNFTSLHLIQGFLPPCSTSDWPPGRMGLWEGQLPQGRQSSSCLSTGQTQSIRVNKSVPTGQGDLH